MMGLLGASGAAAAPSAPTDETPALIPQPLELVMEGQKPGFLLTDGIRVDAATSRSELGRAAVRALMAAGFRVLPEEREGDVQLRQARGMNPEWYALEVSPSGISMTVNDPKGLYLAAQTLAQAVVRDREGREALPCMRVEDEPLLHYRGIMIDVARYFRTVEEMKQVIRLMARYKLNVLHWHLTDDQGWRLEIRKYPKLTQLGSQRPCSPTIEDPGVAGNQPHGGFYTQQEVRDVVAYAKAHGITVIPEIEVPGHNCALMAAYPELGNDDIPGYAPRVATGWGVHPYVMAPKPATFTFIRDVFDEVCKLFPDAPYIHIGGDEVPREQWEKSETAHRFMQEKGLSRCGDIQHYFTDFCVTELDRHGRRIIGWDEIMEDGKIPASAVVMVWRNLQYAYPAIRKGHDVILTPNSHFYLDYGQGKFPADPSYRGIGTTSGFDWQKVYSFDPQLPGLTPEEQQHVIGVQGNLWGEYLHNSLKFQYQLVPRLCAVAEVGWLPKARRDEADFARRLRGQYDYFDSEKLNFREEDGTPRLDREAMTRPHPLPEPAAQPQAAPAAPVAPAAPKPAKG